MVTTFAAAGPVAKLLIAKGLITEKEFWRSSLTSAGCIKESWEGSPQSLLERMRQTVFYWLFALFMIEGFWLAYAIVVAKLLRRRPPQVRP